ncbi:MAG: sensor histidine kinase [Atopobiaceae bacterium]|nr:sensor histidine kinase [Atopobiaceae bacterium]
MSVLGALRRKFVLVTTALLGIVLAGVLVASVWTSWSQSVSQLDDSLRMALMLDDEPIGAPGMGFGPGPERSGNRGANLMQPVIVFDYEDGEVEIDDFYFLLYDLDESTLDGLARTIVASPAYTGALPDMHLRWMRMETASGYRIAVCDSSVVDEGLTGQVVRAAAIFLAGIGSVAIISMFLARWALAPVEESWEQQKRFVADASHELKTPLAVMLANSQILADHADRIPSEEMRWIESSTEEATRMKALVDDLLELARVDESAEKTMGAASKQDLDLSDMVSKVALQFEAIAFERGCTIDPAVEDGIRIEGDRDSLERLVSVLVDNACKYAAPGSAIEVELGRTGNQCILSVRNQGEPIPASEIPHVFERFYRSDAARTKDSTGGYGLGLAIAKGIADAHGAELRVSSSAAEGTVFTFATRIPS